MDIVDRLFVAMFDSLNQKCKKDLEAVGNQYPFEPLKVSQICYVEDLSFSMPSVALCSVDCYVVCMHDSLDGVI